MPTGIPYADEAVNAFIGCTHAGMKGCDNCWARELHNMRHKAYLAGRKLPIQYAKLFSEIQILEERIELPLRLRKPRVIAWNFMGDTFHEKIPFEKIDRVMAVIALTPQHTHLFLTKRAKRAEEYFFNCNLLGIGQGDRISNGIATHVNLAPAEIRERWPLPNLWHGFSSSTQPELDEIVPVALQIPAAVRFLSLEPLLGEVIVPLESCREDDTGYEEYGRHIDWVIVGCERLAGNRAGRFCEDEDKWWAACMNIVSQCQAANVPVYVKQGPVCGKVTENLNDWPFGTQVQEYPK